MNSIRRFAGDGETLVVSTGYVLTEINAKTGEIVWDKGIHGFVVAQQNNPSAAHRRGTHHRHAVRGRKER